MRANIENKSLDIEARDVNYILPAYIRSYLYISKNEDPERIIFPMFPSVPHPTKPGVQVPIDWLPPIDLKVAEIAEDGSNIAEVTPEQEAALDEKDKAAEELKKEEASVAKVEKDDSKKAQEATKPSERVPKQPPGGDLGTGHPDGLGSRDVRLDRKIAQDLRPEPKVDESKEKEADIGKV